ncbi:MAG TPA: hypothetical protein VFV19_00675 [Candidatus Polarisedimenticolaceae bacterium]|nr:hypothetical protein [Candidatus Polarisedimenticolaceae bacterium]
MTGSGKTGLGIGVIEEAAIDGIPTIAIDPKGDLANLLLAFPNLSPQEFAPWVEEGTSADDAAAKWTKGLASWGEDAARVKRYKDAVDMAIYTPGSSAGLPLSILRSLAAPGDAVTGDDDAFREKINGTVSGLLALLGIAADPLRSREHILLSKIVETSWKAGKDVDLAALIQAIQKPPFDRVGVVDTESFYPAKDRGELALTLNNLLASPGFEAWLTGEPLDIQRLLWTEGGKPRISVLSIAHLSDAERMFFVTLLLNELVAWMRGQAGTSSLRALFYMDEVFGFFPPTAAPPAKAPMLTLLKQARAFGLGCVLATQNPVDLDYKGLSNAGTWFLGRLQTERDKMRVIEGLEGASTAAGKSFDRQKMEATLAGLGNRVFLMNNVHEDAPVLFETRWTLSYLRGPLTKKQIQVLMAPVKAPRVSEAVPSVSTSRPMVPAGVRESFLKPQGAPAAGDRLVYRPALLGTAKLHFVDAKTKLDTWSDVALLLAIGDGDVSWDSAEELAQKPALDTAPQASASFDALPSAAAQPKSYAAWSKDLAEMLYRVKTLDLRSAPDLKLTGKVGESEGDFKVRVQQAMRERRDAAIEALRAKYGARLETLHNQEARANDRVAREQAQATQQTVQTAISVGATVLGALFGRKTLSAATIGRATTAARGVGRTLKERQDVGGATEGVDAIHAKVTEMESELQSEIDGVTAANDPDKVAIENTSVKPRKSDVTVDGIALLWVPWWLGEGGSARPAR